MAAGHSSSSTLGILLSKPGNVEFLIYRNLTPHCCLSRSKYTIFYTKACDIFFWVPLFVPPHHAHHSVRGQRVNVHRCTLGGTRWWITGLEQLLMAERNREPCKISIIFRTRFMVVGNWRGHRSTRHSWCRVRKSVNKLTLEGLPHNLRELIAITTRTGGDFFSALPME